MKILLGIVVVIILGTGVFWWMRGGALFNPVNCSTYTNEEDCVTNDKCRPIRTGGTFGSFGFFKECVNIPKEELIKAKKNKKLCENSGGEWSVGSAYDRPGRCECLNEYDYHSEEYYQQGRMFFLTDYNGCIRYREVCEQNGGIWEVGTDWYYTSTKLSKSECEDMPNAIVDKDFSEDYEGLSDKPYVICKVYEDKQEWGYKRDDSRCLVDGQKVDVSYFLR